MEIKYWAGTDVGRKRSDNEDNFLIDKRLRLFVVADGMGGHASGEIASAMAVHGIREVLDLERDILDVYDDDDPKSHVEVCTLLEYAVHYTCAQIFHKARREPEKRGMGTTLVVLLVIGARGFIAYVGDSRIYLLRGGIVYQLTEDHSLRNELIRMGKITADEFESSPYANLKNAMTRAVGVYESVEVDTLDFDIIPGDAFLLCSDGLYEYLSDDDISNAIALPQIREVPGMLIDAANSRGGKDNITAVVVQVAGGEDDQDRAAELNFTLDTLKNVPLFRELSYQQLVRVMNLSRQSALAPGQVLCREGEPGQELMVVLRGRVELTRNGVNVAELGPGAHLGEMSLIDAGLRSVTATAIEPGKVLAISRDDFYEVLRREPALAVKLLWSFVRVLAERLRTTTADLAVARTSHAHELTEIVSEASRSTQSLPIFDPDDEIHDEIHEIDELEHDADEEDELERRPTVISGMLGPKPAAGRRVTVVSTTTKAPHSSSAEPEPGAPEPPGRSRTPIGTPLGEPRTTSPEHTMSSAAQPRPHPSSGPANTGDTVVAPQPRPRPSSGPTSTANPGDTVVPASAQARPHPSSGPNTGITVIPPSAEPRPRPSSGPNQTVVPPSAEPPPPPPPSARPSTTGDTVIAPAPEPPSTRPSNTGDTVIPPSAAPRPRAPQTTKPNEGGWSPPQSDVPKRRGTRRSTMPQVPGTPFTPATPSKPRPSTSPAPAAGDAPETPSSKQTTAPTAAPIVPPVPVRRDDTMIAPRPPLPSRAPTERVMKGEPISPPPVAARSSGGTEPSPTAEAAPADLRRTQAGPPPRVPPPPPTGAKASDDERDEPATPPAPPAEPDA